MNAEVACLRPLQRNLHLAATNRLAPVTARCDVENRVEEFDAQGAGIVGMEVSNWVK